MPLTAEIVVKVTCAVLFLLFAYFMIGGYTPCNDNKTYPIGARMFNEHMNSCGNSDNNNRYDTGKTIYQMAPYI